MSHTLIEIFEGGGDIGFGECSGARIAHQTIFQSHAELVEFPLLQLAPQQTRGVALFVEDCGEKDGIHHAPATRATMEFDPLDNEGF